MDRNKVSKYLQICKKYDYEQILNENVEFQDEKDIITYIKMLGKLENIYDKYHEMKSGGGSGGKGAKSKSSKSKSKQKKKHKEHDGDEDDNYSHNTNHHQQYSPAQNNLLVEGLEVAGLTAVGTSLYNSAKNSSRKQAQSTKQSQQSVQIDLNKEQSEKLKLEILNEIEKQLTLPDSVLSVLLENRINKILEKQK